MRLRYCFVTLVLIVATIGSCDNGPTAPESVPAVVEAASPAFQFAVAGTEISTLPSVIVKDSAGEATAGIRVEFAVIAGNGSAAGTSVLTDASGVATLGSWKVGAAAGINTVTATVRNLPPVSFNADALEPGWVVKSIETANGFTCAVTANRAGYCWGGGAYGSLGAGSAPTLTTKPVVIAGNLIFESLDTKSRRNCGINDVGLAFCWGYSRQIGDCCEEWINQPSAVGGGLTFSWISTGAEHVCALTAASKAYCWGKNDLGQLGDGTTTESIEPVPVLGNLTFTSLAAGFYHTCGIATSGDAYCWGDNGSGQLGDGTLTRRLSPAVITGGTKFKNVSAGFGYTCGVAVSGAAYCWGRNDGPGNLGDGTTEGKLAPTAVIGGHLFNSISAGFGSTCGVATNGFAYCWGSNDKGKLGDATVTNRLSPVATAYGLRFQAIAASLTHSCGLTTAGNAYCWGGNFNGALGNGVMTLSANPLPTPVRAP